MNTVEARAPRLWRWLPRYSLRTLLLASLLAGAAGLVWRNWAPWPLKRLVLEDRFWNASFSPDSKWLVTCSGEGCHIWRMPDGTLVRKLDHPQAAREACWSPDGRLCTVAYDYATRLWDPQTWDCTQVLERSTNTSGIDLSPDGTTVLTHPEYRKSQLWDTQTGTRLAELDESHNIKGYSSDSRLILFEIYWHWDGKERTKEQENDKGIELWDAHEGRRLWRVTHDEYKWMESLRFSDDGTRVIAAMHEIDDEFNRVQSVREYGVQKGELIAERQLGKGGSAGHSFTIGGWSWRDQVSLDGTRKLRLTENGIEMEDIPNKRTLGILPGFKMSISAATAAFSPDGRQIVAGNWFHKNDICLWTRRRPEYWWGAAWLPEFWLAALLAGAMLWSILTDRRQMCRSESGDA